MIGEARRAPEPAAQERGDPFAERGFSYGGGLLDGVSSCSPVVVVLPAVEEGVVRVAPFQKTPVAPDPVLSLKRFGGCGEASVVFQN